MNGFFLLLPFLVIRFLLPAALDGGALARAAHFAPMRGGEKIASLFYQGASVGILLCPFFLQVQEERAMGFFWGLAAYLVGLCLCVAAMVSFSSPAAGGLRTKGLYRFSRNPMYLAYFLVFLGMALLTRSALLLGLVVAFQASAHWVILAEERWCAQTFGQRYEEYRKNVRRYL